MSYIAPRILSQHGMFLHLQLKRHASPLDSSNPEIELLHLAHWPGVPTCQAIFHLENSKLWGRRGSKLTKVFGCVYFLIIFNHTTIVIVYQFESEPSMNATEVHLEKGCEKHGFHPHRVELRHSNYCSNSSNVMQCRGRKQQLSSVENPVTFHS